MKRTLILAILALSGAFSTRAGSPEIIGNLSEVADGYGKTSVNTTIFRTNSLATRGDTQYIGFYDPDGVLTLGKRRVNTDNWELHKTQYKGNVQDAHNVISLGVDGDGVLHVAFDHHGHPLHYAKGIAPGSLTLGAQEPMTGIDEGNVTYPEFYTLADGDLLFVYRSGASGRGNMAINRYNTKEGKWVRIQDNLLDGQEQRSPYWQMYVDQNGVIHVSWVWRETWLVETNHDMCYARSEDGGKTWKKSNGSTYKLPITAENAEYACRIPQNSELINQTSMTADSKSHPYIVSYWRETDSSVPQYRLVWNDGKKWRQKQISNRTLPFSLSGGGTKMIPIARPKIVADGDFVCVLYRDEERGSKVSAIYTTNGASGDWKIKDLTDFSVGAWEPSIDNDLWREQKRLNVFVQATSQGDGEKTVDTPPTPVYVMEVSRPATYNVTVKNTLDHDMEEKIVEVDATGLKGIAPGLVVVRDAMGKEIPSQFTYDWKVIFPASVKKGDKALYSITAGIPTPTDTLVTGERYEIRLDDMAWENDLAAYRAYGPALQRTGERAFGYDVWTKSVKHPVVKKRIYGDKIHHISFHVDHGEGMDVYGVGPTLGGGTAALLNDNGEIVYPYCYDTYEILDNGPLRFTVRLNYAPIEIDGDSVRETRLISLDRGEYLNKTSIRYEGLSKGRTIVPGLVIHDGNPDGYVLDKDGKYMAYADMTQNPKAGDGIIFVGIVSPQSHDFRYVPFDKPKGDAIGHILAPGFYKPGDTFTYYWGSGWSKGFMPDMETWIKTLIKAGN